MALRCWTASRPSEVDLQVIVSRPTREPVASHDTQVRDSLLDEFERLYRAEVGQISRYFGRRSHDPETVVDLTAEKFLEALKTFRSFDPTRGTGRAWLFAIARRVEARHWDANRRWAAGARSSASAWILDDGDAVDELVARIDDQRTGRVVLARMAALKPVDRPAVELVDISGLKPREAALALGVSAAFLRVRLCRARALLRRIENECV